MKLNGKVGAAVQAISAFSLKDKSSERNANGCRYVVALSTCLNLPPTKAVAAVIAFAATSTIYS